MRRPWIAVDVVLGVFEDDVGERVEVLGVQWAEGADPGWNADVVEEVHHRLRGGVRPIPDARRVVRDRSQEPGDLRKPLALDR